MVMFPDLCCYSFPSLGEGTWRKTLTVLSSADKNEINGVRKQGSNRDNGKDFAAGEYKCAYIEMRIIRRLFWQILTFYYNVYL
jgi:hypothetical protein